jgi:hypothetical protein
MDATEMALLARYVIRESKTIEYCTLGQYSPDDAPSRAQVYSKFQPISLRPKAL